MTKRIGIIGGGASGVLSALQLWKKLGAEVQLFLIDPAVELGRGKAYATPDSENLLNVPAERMSAYPDSPRDFETWVLDQEPALRISRHWPFVPRRLFGQYLGERLAEIPAAQLTHIRAKAEHIEPGALRYRVRVEGGQTFDFDHLVVATGYQENLLTRIPLERGSASDRVISLETLERLPKGRIQGSVAIIGSGLTAIDAWRRLKDQPGVKVTFLSRRGLLPQTHLAKTAEIPEFTIPTLAGMSPLQVLQVLRCLQRSHGLPWAAIADRVRPQAQRIWSCWTDREKARFTRHAKPYWEVIRHRLPGTVALDLEQALGAGTTRIYPARIRATGERNGRFEIRFDRAHVAGTHLIHADWIVLATGSSIDQGLLERSMIPGLRACPHGFGYRNESAPRLWVVGPASKTTYWEITAVPDIREQAASIAEAIRVEATKKRPLWLERLANHPDSVGESYFEHLRASTRFGLRMWRCGWYAFVHALVPFLHLDTTSSQLRNLHPTLSRRRQRLSHR